MNPLVGRTSEGKSLSDRFSRYNWLRNRNERMQSLEGGSGKQRPFLKLFIGLTLIALLSVSTVIVAMLSTRPVHAATANGLSVFVAYAEDKETNTPDPSAFPTPWQGAPNTVFLGGPVTGQVACHHLTSCFDAGGIRLDNSGTSDVAISGVSVDVHSSIPGGAVINLWGSFTVPAGKSVILTENPPNNNPTYDNFDTSAYPKNNCVPITVAPTVTITSGGVSTTLVDSTHVLDTGGIDIGSCKPQQNESYQWRTIGATGVKTASLSLSPTTTTLPVGQAVTETATLLDGSGNGLPNTSVNFAVTSGPNSGQMGSAVTDGSRNAAFSYTDTAPGSDSVVASVTTVGTFQSNVSAVQWGNPTPTPTPTPTPPPTWSSADIGNPALAGSSSVSNGTWTISGAGLDIGGTADQFHYVWEPLAADGGIRAQVLTITNTNSRARAGVMLRQSTDPSSAFYAVVVTAQRGIFVLQRTDLGSGVNTVTSLATGTTPVYLQVERAGNTFTAYTSSDGISWTLIPGSSSTPNLTGPLLAGMAVTAHTASKINTSTFDTVSTP